MGWKWVGWQKAQQQQTSRYSSFSGIFCFFVADASLFEGNIQKLWPHHEIDIGEEEPTRHSGSIQK